MNVNVLILGDNLAMKLLQKVLNILHTFLPASQYGDVIWSLGRLQYRKDMLDTANQNRLLAVRAIFNTFTAYNTKT